MDQHRRDFKRLGVFGQWDEPYLTMSPQYEACIADAFLTFLEKGYAYRGLKPVYWCIYDRTALAEAEVEYEDHTSPSIWIRYAVTRPPAESAAAGTSLRAGLDDHSLDVAGQSRAGLPSALRVRRGRDDHGKHRFWRGTLVGQASCRSRALRCAEPGPGKILWGARFRHPFLDCEVPGVLADYVTLEQGTGVVHTAPGHGADDYRTGQKYGLDAYAPLDDDGRFVEGLPEYKGKTVFEANPAVIALLKSRGALFAERKFRTAIRIAGAATIPSSSARPSNGSYNSMPGARRARRSAAFARAGANSQGAVDACVGHGAHALDDRRAAGLVRFAAAILGRADGGPLLRCMRQAV